MFPQVDIVKLKWLMRSSTALKCFHMVDSCAAIGNVLEQTGTNMPTLLFHLLADVIIKSFVRLLIFLVTLGPLTQLKQLS